MRYTIERYDGENKLLAGVKGLRSPVHITLDASKVSADAEGNKHIDAGFWVAKSGEYGRPLPRTGMRVDAATTDTVLQVDNAQAFIPGDVVYAVPASAQIDLGAAWAIGNSITITVAGIAYTYTAIAAGTAEQFAAAVAADFNVSPQVRGLAQVIAGTNALTVVAKDFKTPHAIAVAAVGGTATIAGGAAQLIPFQMLGTIDTNGVDVTNKTLTLNATAAVAIAKGVPVGTADIPIGFHLRGHDMRHESEEAGLYTSLSGKRGAFPYLDSGLESDFVEIQAVNA